MRFTLEIKLGNDAMQDRMDVAGALERVSHTLAASPLPDDTQHIRDLNGQPVGRWRFEESLPSIATLDQLRLHIAAVIDYNWSSEFADAKENGLDGHVLGHLIALAAFIDAPISDEELAELRAAEREEDEDE